MSSSAREIRVAKLKASAEERKRITLERAEKAIHRLLLEDKRLTFPNIANEAGISVSYLYKYPELKSRIQTLRLQREHRLADKALPRTVSDKSKDAVIARLRERVQKLEAEREEQKKHLAVLSGQMYEQSGDGELLKRLRQENKRLAARVRELEAASSLATSPPSAESLAADVKQELDKLEIRLTPSLQEKIVSYPPSRVLDAIAVVREALTAGHVRSRSRLFIKALDEGWEPEADSSTLDKAREAREFSRWFDAARGKGLVRASRGTKKGILVLTSNGKWAPYAVLKQKKGWSMQELEAHEQYSS